jgi:nickel-dependent lactate racemase
MSLGSINPSGAGHTDRALTEAEARQVAAELLCPLELDGKRVLVIVPDATRTAPVGMMFRLIHELVGARVAKMDVMIALGTHQPMSEKAINQRLEISAQERSTRYAAVDLYNHAWDDASQLRHIGDIPRQEIRELSGGLFEMDVPVAINRRVFDYDLLLILGPVFPHEVVGFSVATNICFLASAGQISSISFIGWAL